VQETTTVSIDMMWEIRCRRQQPFPLWV